MSDYKLRFQRGEVARNAYRGPGMQPVGDTMHYYSVLKKLHTMLSPAAYLETGVRNGESIALADPGTYAYGIDPCPDVTVPLSKNTTLFACTSDEFFERFDLKNTLKLPINLCFLDGMHLFEFALRDFINMEAHCDKHSLIAVHDSYPESAVAAARERVSQVWCGDVFKLQLALKKYRPDLRMLHLDSGPAGLLLIKNLDPSSTVLRDNYEAILGDFLSFDFKTIEKNARERLLVVPYDEKCLQAFTASCAGMARARPPMADAPPSAANHLFSRGRKKREMRSLGVLLCYNDGDFLAENIEYLLSQNHHVIAWDHGSDDTTASVLETYREHLLETRCVPRDVDFYVLYPLMSRHIINNHMKNYDVVSWPDQDEILEGPFRDRTYHDYLLEFHESPFSWIRFNNMNFWYSNQDGDAPKTVDRVKYYSDFPDCSPRIRAWKAAVTNIRKFNHNPLASGMECPVRFNLRHYPFRSEKQLRKRILIDRANLERGGMNFHYNAMKSRIEQLEQFDASKELHFDDGKELRRIPSFDWMRIYGN